jgi:hypothetical protein
MFCEEFKIWPTLRIGRNLLHSSDWLYKTTLVLINLKGEICVLLNMLNHNQSMFCFAGKCSSMFYNVAILDILSYEWWNDVTKYIKLSDKTYLCNNNIILKSLALIHWQSLSELRFDLERGVINNTQQSNQNNDHFLKGNLNSITYQLWFYWFYIHL